MGAQTGLAFGRAAVLQRRAVEGLHLFPRRRGNATIVPLPTLAGSPLNGSHSHSAMSTNPASLYVPQPYQPSQSGSPAVSQRCKPSAVITES